MGFAQRGVRNFMSVSTMMREGTVKLKDDTVLHYTVAGESDAVVLCIPGALGTARTDFGPQLDGLSDSYTVVSFDPRGYGRSQPPVRTFSPNFYEEDATDAAELMEKLKINRYSVLGWSDGANCGTILV